MPVAAVIPAPLAYTIIVAVKRLVVGLVEVLSGCDTPCDTVNKSECSRHASMQ